jgi:hypothetical protein
MPAPRVIGLLRRDPTRWQVGWSDSNQKATMALRWHLRGDQGDIPAEVRGSVASYLCWSHGHCVGGWAYLVGRSGSPSGLDLVTETDFFLGSWGYLYFPLDTGAHVAGYAHPPIIFWVGLVLWAFLAGVPVGPTRAIAAAKGKGSFKRRGIKKTLRDESRNVRAQERGWAARSPAVRTFVSIASPAQSGPGDCPLAGRHPMSSRARWMTSKGLIVWVCLVGSVLPSSASRWHSPWPRERVWPDAAGNVRGADELR